MFVILLPTEFKEHRRALAYGNTQQIIDGLNDLPVICLVKDPVLLLLATSHMASLL
jgi:hypothetical protein